MGMVRVIGHRGACAYAPENTMASFNLAIAMGADGIETDIRATADNRLVLLHDGELSRVSDGEGRVEEHSCAELARLDFGMRFGERFAGERVVLLDDFLAAFGGRTHLDLEIKARGIDEAALRAVRNRGIPYCDYVFTSFEEDILLNLRSLDSDVVLGKLERRFGAEEADRCAELKINHICPRAADMTPEATEYAHKKGLYVRAWGVKDTVLMEHAVNCGADGMTVNFPDKLIEYLKTRA